MATESDAVLIARFPHEAWNQPLPITNHETKEVRYDCRLCLGLKNNNGPWENLPADEAVILKHIEEVHGLKSVSSAYVYRSLEEAEKDCKAVSLSALYSEAIGLVHRIFHPH